MKAILEGTITKNPNSAPRKPERRPFPHAISFANNEAQTVFNNFLDESPLRKEFIGELTEDSFTDRDLLKFEKLTTIRALHIYYTERGIAAVKAFYVVHEHNNNTSEVVTKSQVPAAYLDKHCKVYRMELLKEDFMKYLKARYNPEEGRITRIQVLSNKGIKYDFAVDRKQPEKSALETNLMEIHDTLV